MNTSCNSSVSPVSMNLTSRSAEFDAAPGPGAPEQANTDSASSIAAVVVFTNRILLALSRRQIQHHPRGIGFVLLAS